MRYGILMSRHYIEVTLSNGTVVTKKATRDFTHALATDQEVLSWHTSENAAHRAWYRKAAHVDGALRIERTRVSS